MKLNKTKMSEFFGVSRSTIHDWERRGAPVSTGDPAAVAKWFVKQRPGAPAVSAERGRLLSLQADIAQIDFNERSGSVHKTEECRRKAFTLGRQLRDMILIVPDRVDAILAAENDRGRVNAMLRMELTAVLTEFSVTKGKTDDLSSPLPAGHRARKAGKAAEVVR